MIFTETASASEVLEKRVYRYDYIIGKDPAACEGRARIAEFLRNLRQVLEELGAPAENIKMLNDLEDLITDLEAQDVRAIATENLCDPGLACNVGLHLEYLMDRIQDR